MLRHVRHFDMYPKLRRNVTTSGINCRHKILIFKKNVSPKEKKIVSYVGYVCRQYQQHTSQCLLFPSFFGPPQSHQPPQPATTVTTSSCDQRQKLDQNDVAPPVSIWHQRLFLLLDKWPPAETTLQSPSLLVTVCRAGGRDAGGICGARTATSRQREK